MSRRNWVSLALVLLAGVFSLQNSMAQGRGGGPKPAPSPDSAIAYSTGALYVMNADGTNKTVVYDKGTSYAPDWSPDAKRLVFVNHVGTGRPAQIGVFLYLVNVDGSGVCKLAKLNETRGGEAMRPAWSPLPLADGNYWIIFSDYSAASYRDLFAVRADCANPGKPVNLTASTENEEWPSWSRFANRLAAAVWTDDGASVQLAFYEVSLMNGVPQLSNRQTLSGLGLSVPPSSAPAWAKNSDRIVFSANSPAGPFGSPGVDLWVTDLTATGTYVITPTADADESRPSWSPDGTEIVFLNMADGWVWKLARQANPDGTESWVRSQQLLYSPISLRGFSWRRCDPCF